MTSIFLTYYYIYIIKKKHLASSAVDTLVAHGASLLADEELELFFFGKGIGLLVNSLDPGTQKWTLSSSISLSSDSPEEHTSIATGSFAANY